MALAITSTQTQTIQATPEAVSFTSSTGEVARYFFKNNPWKCSFGNSQQKIFRFCVICGSDKFPKERWDWERWDILRSCGILRDPPTICNKISCYDALAMMPRFVPIKHYLVQTELDQERIRQAKEQAGEHLYAKRPYFEYPEYFEDMEPEITALAHRDTVYSCEEEMPAKYRDVLAKLERYPAVTRISEIDRIYTEYLIKNQIPLQTYMSDSSDPFLKMLATYREQCIKILDGLNSKK